MTPTSPSRGLLYATLPEYDVFKRPQSNAISPTDESTTESKTVTAQATWTGAQADD